MNGWEVVTIINLSSIGSVRKMHLKFQLNALIGSGVVTIKDFEFNQSNCLAAVLRKLNDNAQSIILRYILRKFLGNPLKGWGVVAIMNLSSIGAAL